MNDVIKKSGGLTVPGGLTVGGDPAHPEVVITCEDWDKFVSHVIRSQTATFGAAYGENLQEGIAVSHVADIVARVLTHSKNYVETTNNRTQVQSAVESGWSDYQRDVAPEVQSDLKEDEEFARMGAAPTKEDVIDFIMQQFDSYMGRANKRPGAAGRINQSGGNPSLTGGSSTRIP